MNSTTINKISENVAKYLCDIADERSPIPETGLSVAYLNVNFKVVDSVENYDLFEMTIENEQDVQTLFCYVNKETRTVS